MKLNRAKVLGLAASAMLVGQGSAISTAAAAEPPNACPVDGCTVEIVAVAKSGDELQLTFDANFTPDMSKNHLHVWWGENYTVQQVSDNAQTVHGVDMGDWHPTADFPVYVTQSAASTSVRGQATTLCVSPANRGHDILDVEALHCVDVADHL